MIQNGLVVYDSEGQIVCSAIVPSNFRRTLTGIETPQLAKPEPKRAPNMTINVSTSREPIRTPNCGARS